jgi:hypothetical protein
MSNGKKVFISYASEDKQRAFDIALSLRDYGLDVFFDRDRLAAGGGYDKTIRDQINSSDIFVFLVSKQSVSPGRYTLTELQFARERWESPNDHVLPVILERTGKVADDVKDLMTYMNHATWLEPHGSIAAEVCNAVSKMIERTAPLSWTTRIRNYAFGDYLKGGVGKSLAYTNADLDEEILRKHAEDGGRIEVEQLKEKLNRSKSNLKRTQFLTVTGHFFPSALLSFGWWDRVNKNLESDIKWKDPVLQRWLFSGFEQWAPSWDLNDWSGEKPFKLVGQIGHNDEADSIPVLIKSESKAKSTREKLANRLVVNANVRGLLCHESHLKNLDTLDEQDTEFLETIKEMTSSQYYMLLLDHEKTHKVEIIDEDVDYYSGYIWQCWSPKEWVPSVAYDTRLPGAYFLWEHTNLAQGDVIKYGMDSLDRKVQFLRKRLRERFDLSGDLVLLQHLMPEGRLSSDHEDPSLKPAIPTAQFRNLFLTRDEASAVP